ncbi:RHS repeat domain-containing protein, partial [Hominisplanchenecus murintestinalis]|uniref:RHS repeat domain-containing protein n=1 Tax=Hominisplanchenecus murintestinalis TaxID=2941517 RepID=UPI002407C795
MDSGEKNLICAYFYTADGKVSEIRDYRGFAEGDSQSYIRKTYAYDTLNRVIGMEYSDSASPGKATESYGYTYDKNSNILTETTGGETTRSTYNSLNRMLTANKTKEIIVLSDRSYVYDANGNLKSETDSILEKSMEYAGDVGNRMVQAVRKEKGEAVLTQTNRYNGSGQRIQKTEDGKTTNYYYQGTAVQATTDAEGNKSSFNLYGLEGNVIASGRYTGSCAGEYLTSGKDLKGSTTSLIKPDGSCAAAYRYTDFGETVIYAAEDVENEICYTGGIYDESTGLYYLNARYYDPQDGRFTSQDTYRGKDEEYKTWNL